MPAPAPNHELDFAKGVIYGSTTVAPPTASYTQQQRLQHIDAYAARVVTQINNIESGEEGESNIRFQKTRQFLEPGGYFSGGLLAAGYDPHAKITVTFTTYTKELNGATHLTNKDERTYFAWEIAAGSLKHDRPAGGGLINLQGLQIKPEDQQKINDLESMGAKLQQHWKDEITVPMQDASGALARRSGKADAYAVKGTLQSLRDNEESYAKLTPAGQEAINRTLDKNGNVIIPNIYGYPLSGYAFVPYINYHGDYDHRPNKGLMIDLKNGTVTEIHGDQAFALWAGKNRGELQRRFNSKDRQGGINAHWPKAVDVLDNLIAGNQASYPGRQNLLKDKAVPVRETFNYAQSRQDRYVLKFGNLSSGIAAEYQAMNANNAQSDDQTAVFGSSQQHWKTQKEWWGNTFGYLPIVGNAGNIVFGVHDALYGMTAEDRVGGSAAAVISGLQLVHEIAPLGVEAGLGGGPLSLEPSQTQHYRWAYNEQTNDFVLVRAPAASNTVEEVIVDTSVASAVAPAPDSAAPFPGMREIEFLGKKYFAADKPDAGDGQHYLLRVRDPNNPSELLSSGIIAKPDAQGVWSRRGVAGGGLEALDARLKDPIGFGSRAMVYDDPDSADHVIKVTFPLPAAQRVAELNNEVKLFNQYYGEQQATFLGSNAADTVSYIRMPKVSGQTLESLMAGGNALPDGVAGGLLNMLADLESAGIVHNDLAARNILYDAGTHKCYPVDFGSAKSVATSFAQSNDRYSIWRLREKIQPDGQSFDEMVELLDSLKTNVIN